MLKAKACIYLRASKFTSTPQSATQEQRDVHVIFLDLANAYIFALKNVLPEAFDSCRVQVALKAVRTFSAFQMCFITTQFTAAWQQR